jgi:hypothetical protein
MIISLDSHCAWRYALLMAIETPAGCIDSCDAIAREAAGDMEGVSPDCPRSAPRESTEEIMATTNVIQLSTRRARKPATKLGDACLRRVTRQAGLPQSAGGGIGGPPWNSA